MTDFSVDQAIQLRKNAEDQLRVAGPKPCPVGIATSSSAVPPSEDIPRLYHELQVHQLELEMQNEELRITQHELAALRDRYFELYDLAPVSYLTLDDDGRIREANLAAATMFGVPRSILLKKPLPQFITPEDRDIYHRHRKNAFETRETQVWEMRLVKASGTIFWANVSASPAKNGEYWITLNDITPLKQAEMEMAALQQQFQQTQKLESLGVLAGGIAHDFNNILAIIMGYCALAKMDSVNARDHIPPIELATERAAELCRQMLTYAGKARSVLHPVDMSEVVGEMVKMLKTTISQNVVVTATIHDDIPQIQADISQLRQIVMNLIVNAAEAIGAQHGDIYVSLSEAVVMGEPTDIDYIGRSIVPGWYVCLEVTDNGCGMDEETRRRIFEPFYTTKFTGRGLGMSAVLGILSAHGGALQLTSTPGRSSTFMVFLPVQCNESPRVKSLQQTDSQTWKGSGTILLAEDEEDIRFIARTILEELGFKVLVAVDGREALSLYQANAADISLVLTDIGMPVMDGYELVKELKKMNAGVLIVISSGFGDADVGARIAGEQIAGLIGKPYTFEQMQAVLKNALGDVQPNRDGGKRVG